MKKSSTYTRLLLSCVCHLYVIHNHYTIINHNWAIPYVRCANLSWILSVCIFWYRKNQTHSHVIIVVFFLLRSSTFIFFILFTHTFKSWLDINFSGVFHFFIIFIYEHLSDRSNCMRNRCRAVLLIIAFATSNNPIWLICTVRWFPNCDAREKLHIVLFTCLFF